MSNQASLDLSPLAPTPTFSLVEPARAEAAPSRKRLWAGRVVSGLPVLFMVFDGAIKLAGIPAVKEGHERLGYPFTVAPYLGVVTLLCVLAYVVPRTAVLGAVLLTGYLGGAVATHVRVGDPFWFPILVGALFWGGLALRDDRVRALLLGGPTRAA